jgi:hypothetical protein
MNELGDTMDEKGSTYRGLSGITSEPRARIVPITHCINRGIRQDRSDLIKEQK